MFTRTCVIACQQHSPRDSGVRLQNVTIQIGPQPCFRTFNRSSPLAISGPKRPQKAFSMLNIRTVVLSATTALLLLGGAVAANAASATATANANIRAGAGPNFPVIGKLARGSRVEIGNCRAGWCELQGRQGFVSQSLLRIGNAKPQPQQPQPQRQQPDQQPQPQQQAPRSPQAPL